jgi:hypothetical protein
MDSIMKPMIAIMMMAMIGGIASSMLATPVVAAEKGTIIINTTPAGAMVSINGVQQGISPITLSVDAGTYSITIQLSGYNDISTSVTVAAGETHTLNASMTLAGGEWTPIDIIWS